MPLLGGINGETVIYKAARSGESAQTPLPIPPLSEFTADELRSFADLVRPYFARSE